MVATVFVPSILQKYYDILLHTGLFPAAWLLGRKRLKENHVGGSVMSSKPIFLSVRRNGSSPIFHIPFPSKLSLKSSYFPTFSWEFFFSLAPLLLRLSKSLTCRPHTSSPTTRDSIHQTLQKDSIATMATAGRSSTPEPILLSSQHTLPLLSHLEKMVDIKFRRKCVQSCRIAGS